MDLRNIVLIAIVLLFFLIFPIFNLYGDWLWFVSVGYSSVFWTILSTSIFLGLVAGVLFFLVMLTNIKIAKKSVLKKGKKKSILLIILVSVFSLIIAAAFGGGWQTYLKFLNSSAFGISDPVFNNDIGFYVFDLPFYNYILTYLIVLISFSILFTFVGYIFYSFGKRKISESDREQPGLGILQLKEFKISRNHISFLVGTLFLLIAVWLYLARFNVLLSSLGTVFGAAYTDVNFILPFLSILSIASIIVALVFFVNIKRNIKPLKAVIAFIVIAVIGVVIAFSIQSFIVKPNEFNLEKPYIERNIEYTLKAYNLDKVDEKPFSVSYNLTMADVEQNKGTIDNIRLWDWKPLMKTYNQIQIFRTYYDFTDVDIDRYNIDGKYKQVMLSARELNQDKLQSKTWINKHLVYTHGYGVAMSPVDKISEEGLPEFYIKDIPPRSDAFVINQPEIYYGEQMNEYAVVKTTTEEFDYPKGEDNIYTTYQGKGGVGLDSFRRFIYALKFGSIEIFVSGSIKPESKILFYRNIDEMASKIAPFLDYDHDPYIVVSDGKIYWIYDAYTTTNKYPYSELMGRINYVRNSVKVVVDAYNGDITYYAIGDEPLIRTYKKIFPSMFKDFSEMPEDLKRHIRYPEDLFKVQAEVYATYHMKDPRVFYNKEDVWKIPYEIYKAKKQRMEPYYIIMKLPEEKKEEFILMMPFTPREKDNMIGWMAARNDGNNFGRIIVYSFSKQELIFGPMQIEARIDQDTEISQKITLWSQAGSDVIRANLLAIPIENSILYVESLYLQATETAVPQFKRVIVAFGNKLTMQEDLRSALTMIFGKEKPTEVIEKTTEQLIAEASEHYSNAQEALKQGDFAKYGEEMKKLSNILERLKG